VRREKMEERKYQECQKEREGVVNQTEIKGITKKVRL